MIPPQMGPQTYEATLIHIEEFMKSDLNVNAIQNNQGQIRAKSSKCGKCGLYHRRSDMYPAHGTTCRACGKPNHWVKVCRSKTSNNQQRSRSKSRKPFRQRGSQGNNDQKDIKYLSPVSPKFCEKLTQVLMTVNSLIVSELFQMNHLVELK